MATKQHTRTTLQTQKDGRQFAIQLLSKLESMTGRRSDGLSASRSIADPKEESGECVLRTGPQSDIVLKVLDEVYCRGTRDAQLGFVSILTDFLADAACGTACPFDISEYGERERAGQLEHWTPGAHKRGDSPETARAV